MVYTQLNVKTDLFKTIQFSIRTQLSSIWPIDLTLSGAITPGQSGPGSDGNKGVPRISQSSSLTGASPSEFLVSYPGHSLVGVLLHWRGTISVFCSLSSSQLLLAPPWRENLRTWWYVYSLSQTDLFIPSSGLFSSMEWNYLRTIVLIDLEFNRCPSNWPRAVFSMFKGLDLNAAVHVKNRYYRSIRRKLDLLDHECLFL